MAVILCFSLWTRERSLFGGDGNERIAFSAIAERYGAQLANLFASKNEIR